MRTSANRQTVSTTARWNMAQSDPASGGAQKRPFLNRQTGQGSNIDQLQRALAVAQQHLESTSDPRLVQNLSHGILLLQAQIARISGVDYSSLDLNEVHDCSTGYVYSGSLTASEIEGTAPNVDGVDQSPISTFAQYQLWGTLRQKITKVSPPTGVTPAGSLVAETDPNKRSNVIRTPNNPKGSTFPTGEPGSVRGFVPHKDTRDTDYTGRFYLQGFTPDTHNLNIVSDAQAGVVTSAQPARGKHGQYLGGYAWQGEQPQNL